MDLLSVGSGLVDVGVGDRGVETDVRGEDGHHLVVPHGVSVELQIHGIVRRG